MNNGIQYVVNKEKGIVVAFVSGFHNELYALNRKYGSLRQSYRWLDNLVNRYPDTYRAIAKCDPRDTFDEKTGKDIATKRLLGKLNYARYNFLMYLYKDILKDLADINDKLAILEDF